MTPAPTKATNPMGVPPATGKRRIILKVKMRMAVFVTKRATPYPLQFARTLANEIKHQRASRVNG